MKNLLILIPIIIGCSQKIYKVENFEPSGSMCLDSFYMNVKDSECSDLVEEKIDEKTISVYCTKSYTNTFWTNHRFYITDSDNMIVSEGIVPLCIDQNILVLTSVDSP